MRRMARLPPPTNATTSISVEMGCRSENAMGFKDGGSEECRPAVTGRQQAAGVVPMSFCFQRLVDGHDLITLAVDLLSRYASFSADAETCQSANTSSLLADFSE